MAGETVRLEGQREFRAALRRMGDDLADLKAAHGEAAEVVKARAITLAPFIAGDLKGSIRSSGTKTRGLVRAGGARVRHAGPIHFGSPKGWPISGFMGFKFYGSGTLTPQPFLYEALDERRNEVLDVYGDRVADIARRRGLDVERTS